MATLKDQIIEVLSSKLRFATAEKKLDNIPAYCPFHKSGNERKPSLYVYVGPTKSDKQATGSSFCHTCQKGWSFSGLVRALDIRRSFVDSVRQIIDEQKTRKSDILSRVSFMLPSVPEAVLGAFEYAPKALLDSGFDKAVLKEFDIGFDHERKRITFPLRDHLGNLVGISGRSVVGEYPRYKIYKDEFREVVPNYELKKGRILWGLDRFYFSRMQAQSKVDRPVIVCEGFKAAMWVAQNGYPNVVALLGVHCSEEQQVLLSRVCNDVILFLDNDGAGQKAMWSIARRLSRSLTTYLVQYPKRAGANAPDELTPEELKSAIQNSKTILQRRIRNG